MGGSAVLLAPNLSQDPGSRAEICAYLVELAAADSDIQGVFYNATQKFL